MANCTFFGRRDSPNEIESILKMKIAELIEKENVDMFYVGNNGNFDRMVLKSLKALKEKYTHIKFWVILAYIPKKRTQEEYELTIIPELVERVPYKYAILERNNWMISKSDFVIGYSDGMGKSSDFLKLAKKKGLIVINIAKKNQVSGGC